jgi:glutamine synthetase
MAVTAPVTMADVQFAIEKGEIDTFLVAFTDGRGRLLGYRIPAAQYLAKVAVGGIDVPASVLAPDDFGFLTLRPDVTTAFRMPWQPDTVGVLAEVGHGDGTPVITLPRAILRQQLSRLDASSLTAVIGSEPEFTVFHESYDDGSRAGYRDLTPSPARHASHSALGSALAEPFVGRVRKALTAVPIAVSSTALGSAPGQHQITLGPQDALRACDQLTIVKYAVMEMAAQAAVSATFMAKFDAEAAGSALQLSVSLRGARGTMTMSDRYDDIGLSQLGKAFIAGQLLHARELCILYAPSRNSYRRFTGEAFAPSAVTWARENRTCAFLLAGTDSSLRLQNRICGSDSNAYLVTAGMIAAGLDGVHRQLHLGPAVDGDGHRAGSPPLPTTHAEAITAWEESEWVAAALGTDVQGHYASIARANDGSVGPAAATDTEAIDRERADCFEIA